jgi:hypothetical protein
MVVERKVEWHPKTLKGISQIPKDGLEFAYLSEDYKQVHQLVWCKDFMQDTIFGFVNRTVIEVYGFTYDPSTDPHPCQSKTRMLVCNWRDKTFEQKILMNCREFLNDIESRLNMSKTIFERCMNPPAIYRKAGVFIINGSKRWMLAPPMISLYTLLIRIGMVHPCGQSAIDTLNQIESGYLKPYNWKPDTETDYGTSHAENDTDFLQGGRSGLNRILQFGDQRLFYKDMAQNYPSTLTAYTIHDHCGLLAFSSKQTEEHFPHWHRLEKPCFPLVATQNLCSSETGSIVAQ